MRILFVFLLASMACALAPPPGFNIHLVREAYDHVLWRGGAPRRDTLEGLQKLAQERHIPLTLIDLRYPSQYYDKDHNEGRLSPAEEARLARALGLRYQTTSSRSAGLPARIDKALQEGDVYVHCMFGVNRTGFTMARYATAYGLEFDRAFLGESDWEAGVLHERAGIKD